MNLVLWWGDLYLLTVDFCLSPDTLSAFYFPPFFWIFFIDLNTLLLFWLFMLWGHPSFRLSHDKLVSQLQNVKKKSLIKKLINIIFPFFFPIFFNTGIEWFESLNNIYWNVCTSGWAANVWMWTWWCGVPLMWDGGCKLFLPPCPPIPVTFLAYLC